ncbi:peptidoglycan DD-metalloendopeptidase family protein [Bacillus mangrovi]|uniref:Peptidoglycan DD-metalloendopeptidase family protein n=1 Tax=Metabacillus mangrovi TaxID=1491830 RepID=A0A7X2S405_9BACI|nr:M23 family metallopeptidase [Metabacillus mangrovi]MTH52987.1 peptidoglycan DD-metalloendopeptidase family protein [Metabacillus mangrovi]
MPNRADEIRKRMAKRKKARTSETAAEPVVWKKEAIIEEEEKYAGIVHTYEGGPDTLQDTGPGHPLFKPQVFVLKLFLSACLVLVMAVVFKNQPPGTGQVRTAVEDTLGQEFQFAAVSAWYQQQFGHPLALFQAAPVEPAHDPEQLNKALPASGRIMENFKANGQGVLIETDLPSIKAMGEGIVISAGQKPDSGLTVVVQHADGSETWYGNLESANIASYDFVKKGQELGTVQIKDNKKGTYYFAIKQGDQFVDPIQVISLD